MTHDKVLKRVAEIEAKEREIRLFAHSPVVDLILDVPWLIEQLRGYIATVEELEAAGPDLEKILTRRKKHDTL